MKRVKFLLVLGICVVVFLWLLGPSDLAGQKEKYSHKYGPVEIPEQIRQAMDSEIDATNQRLATLIELLPGIPPNQIGVIQPLIEKAFEKTYLKDPTFRPEGEEPVKGWGKILPALQKKLAKREMKGIRPRSVEVSGKFLPYNLTRKPCPSEDIDLKLTILTIFDLGSSDGFEGEACHRRTCEPVECDGNGPEQ